MGHPIPLKNFGALADKYALPVLESDHGNERSVTYLEALLEFGHIHSLYFIKQQVRDIRRSGCEDAGARCDDASS